MARGGYLILDSDLHMMEPDDRWARYLEGPHRANLPQFFSGGINGTSGRTFMSLIMGPGSPHGHVDLLRRVIGNNGRNE